ncbi:MAG TPA: hypothetical protein VF210_05440 [Pseudomonadales bacterium]
MSDRTLEDRPEPRRGRVGAIAAGICLAASSAPVAAIVGGGLYDFIVQTNCVFVEEQQDTRTPYWARERIPVFGAANARGYVRTVDQPDIIDFTSSDPAVVPAPPRLQAIGAIGGVGYQQTEVTLTIKAPNSPRDVTITAKGQPKLDIGTVTRLGQGASDTMKLRVYPPQSIASVSLSPTPPPGGYRDGERVTVTVRLAQKHPLPTSRIVVDQPTYETAAGGRRTAPIRGWSSSGGQGPKELTVAGNRDTITFSFETRFPEDAKTSRLSSPAAPLTTALTMPVRIQSSSPNCPNIVKSTSAKTLTIPMQKPVPIPVLQKESPAPVLPSIRPRVEG